MSNEVFQSATWSDVAPLLARWWISLVPHRDGTWDVVAWAVPENRPRPYRSRVPFAALTQAIADVAGRCEDERHNGEGER